MRRPWTLAPLCRRRARSRLDLERAGRAAADKAAAVPSYAAQTGGLRRATLTRRSHAGLPEPGQARSGRMPVAQFASDGRRSRPSKMCPSSGTTVSELRQAGCSQVRLSRGASPFAETPPRGLPPVSRDHGLRLRLKSAASSRLPLSRFCRANLEPWAIVPLVRAVRSREVNTSGPSPRVKLTGPQSWSFGRGASPPRLSFRPPAAKPGCCPPSDSKF